MIVFSFVFDLFFFFNDTGPTDIYTYGHTLSLHDARPISSPSSRRKPGSREGEASSKPDEIPAFAGMMHANSIPATSGSPPGRLWSAGSPRRSRDRKSTRLNSSH